MTYLRGFLPWIVFAAVSAAGWQWGALAGLVLGLWLVVQARRAGIGTDALILEHSTLLYFAVLTAFAFARTDSGLHHYTGALSMAWLAVTVWTTLAVGRPFTSGIARRQAPPEVWDNPVFLRINVVLTTAWGVAFTITAVVLTTVTAAGLGAAATVPVQIVGFALPALFTARYPEKIRARAAATAAPAATADVVAEDAAGRE